MLRARSLAFAMLVSQSGCVLTIDDDRLIADPPRVVGSSSDVAPTGGTTLTFAMPQGSTAGDLLFAVIAGHVAGAGDIGAPAGWTALGYASDGGQAYTMTQALYWRARTPADSTSPSWQIAGPAAGLLLAIHGFDAAQPFDAVGEGHFTGGATNFLDYCSAPSLTTTEQNALLLGAFASNGHAGLAVDPPLQAAAQANSSDECEVIAGSEVRATAGATGDRTAHESTVNASNLGQLVAIRPAPHP